MFKRVVDIVIASFLLLLLLPLFVLIALLIKADSKGPVFFKQIRVGQNNIDFKIWKFRTMFTDSERHGQLTVGGRDPRVTSTGFFLRSYKLDELPQLINVLNGSMSLVGPRPEVRKYVNLYNAEQMKVLSVKPGITDYASIEYSDENELLSKSPEPEETYVNDIMPAKLSLNLKYINEQSFFTDLKIIFNTVKKIILGR